MVWLPLVAGVALAIAVVTAARSIRIVEEGTLEALLVFGEMEAVLQPGLHIVPPFVSQTYPIDPSSMTMRTGDGRTDVPDEYRDEVRDAADETATDW